MQFTVSFKFGTKHMPNMKTCLVRTETKLIIKAVHCSWGIYLCLFIFDHTALSVCVKDKACLRLVIAAYCFNISGSIFGVRKLILGSKTIWQSTKKVPRTV